MGGWVTPSHVTSVKWEDLFSSFGITSICFAVHLLIRALSCTLPDNSTSHDKRQVPAPREGQTVRQQHKVSQTHQPGQALGGAKEAAGHAVCRGQLPLRAVTARQRWTVCQGTAQNAPPYLSLLFRELTSLFIASAVSVASSSSRWSFLRDALAR